jgi:hypothetical protein
MCEKCGEVCKEDAEIITRIISEAEHNETICAQVCPKLWQSRGEQAVNGYIDTYSCKLHFCTNMLIVKPYTDVQLLSALREHCEAANKSSIEWNVGDGPCEEYDRIKKPEDV